MPDTVTIKRRAAMLEAEVDGELVALDAESGTCYGFNPTATRIWALLAEPLGFDALCDRLSEEYEVEPAECRKDVANLLRELHEDGLIEVDGPLPAE